MIRFNLQFSLACLLSVLIPSAAADSDPYPLHKVTDGSFYHQGLHEDATAENIGAIANVGFIMGEDCVAVIDSGGSYKEGNCSTRRLRSRLINPFAMS